MNHKEFPPNYDALLPFLTEKVTRLAEDRLFNGLKFFQGHTLKPEFERGEVKKALLYARIINPVECLTEDEKAIIEGGQKQSQPVKPHSAASSLHLAASPRKSKKRGIG